MNDQGTNEMGGSAELLDAARETIHCKGDAFVEDLRIARGRMDRTYDALRTAVKKARSYERRFDVGTYVEDVIEDLEEDLAGEMLLDASVYCLRGDNVLECVLDAEGDDFPSPDARTWPVLRALGKAMIEYAAALQSLGDAERLAAPLCKSSPIV